MLLNIDTTNKMGAFICVLLSFTHLGLECNEGKIIGGFLNQLHHIRTKSNIDYVLNCRPGSHYSIETCQIIQPSSWSKVPSNSEAVLSIVEVVCISNYK